MAIMAITSTQAIWPFTNDKLDDELFTAKWEKKMGSMGEYIDQDIFKVEIDKALKQRKKFNIDGTAEKFLEDAPQVVYGVILENLKEKPELDVDSIFKEMNPHIKAQHKYYQDRSSYLHDKLIENLSSQYAQESSEFPSSHAEAVLRQIMYKYDRAAYDVYKTLNDNILLQTQTDTSKLC